MKGVELDDLMVNELVENSIPSTAVKLADTTVVTWVGKMVAVTGCSKVVLSADSRVA